MTKNKKQKETENGQVNIQTPETELTHEERIAELENEIAENGWQIRYTYADADPEALPTRLDLRYLDAEQEIDLRLRLETWRTDP